MTWETAATAVLAGLVVSLVTTPAGVSGAVFLLPVQLSLLHVPSPAVTPTNLLFNVVAGPGALHRHWRAGRLRTPLAGLLLAGTVPGVVVGAVVRVVAVPGPRVFQLMIALVLLPLGGWLLARRRSPGDAAPGRRPTPRTITGTAFGVGILGGIYGIGGGSLLGPILAARGMALSVLAPAALASTFVTSIVGATTYALLSLVTDGDIAPHWWIGLLCGLGGLIGGHLGARLSPHLPDMALRRLLGVLAIALGVLYAARSVRWP